MKPLIAIGMLVFVIWLARLQYQKGKHDADGWWQEHAKEIKSVAIFENGEYRVTVPCKTVVKHTEGKP